MQSQWQPIETAPKDGTDILIYGTWNGEINGKGEIGIWIACYAFNQWEIMGGDAYSTWVSNATHWMPLPEPPK